MATPTMLPPPPPLDPSLVTRPPTQIYAGGQIPGAPPLPPGGQQPAAPPPVSVVTPGVQQAGTPPVTAASALAKLQQRYKETTGQDLTPEMQGKLLGGELVRVPGAGMPTVANAPAGTGFAPRGFQTLRGRESAAQVGMTQQQTTSLRAADELAKQKEANRRQEAMAGLSGYIGGGAVSATDLGLDLAAVYEMDSSGKAVLDDQGKPKMKAGGKMDDVFALGDQLAEILPSYGLEATQQNIDALLAGKTVYAPRIKTLEAKKAESQIAVDKTQMQIGQYTINVGTRRQELDEKIAKAQATGFWEDTKNGKRESLETLESRKLQLEYFGRTGTIDEGSKTLQALAQNWDQEFKETATFGGDWKPAAGGPSVHVYGTNELPMIMQNDKQQFDKLLTEGYWYTDSETGERRRVRGTDERIDDEQKAADLARTGYDDVVYILDAQGRPEVDAQGNRKPVMVDGKPLMRHIQGTQETQAAIANRQADLQEKGMDLSAAHDQAVLEADTRKFTGFYQARTINMKDLGLDRTVPTSAMGSADAFMRWIKSPENATVVTRLSTALGRPATDAELQQLFKGDGVAMVRAVTTAEGRPVTDRNGAPVYEPIVDYIEGTQDIQLKQQQLQRDLQDNDFTNDAEVMKAQQDFQKTLLTGFTSTDPLTGNHIWVRGTQDAQEHLLWLQSQYGLDEIEAKHRLDEETRNGYEQIIDVVGDDGKTYQKRVRVEGTDGVAASERERDRQLQRDGWDATASAQRAADEREEKQRIGYFRTESFTVPNGPRAGQLATRAVWVPGTQEHQLDTLDKQIAADDTRESKNRLHAAWIQDRSFYYQDLADTRKMNRADAIATAEREWNSDEKVLDRALQVSLETMRNDATVDQQKRQERQGLMGAALGALATIGSGIATRIFSKESLSQQFTDAILSGKVTAKDFEDGTAIQKIGGSFAAEVTKDQAKELGAKVVAKLGEEELAASYLSSQSAGGSGALVGTGPAETFGSQLAGVAVPVAVAAAFVYAGYKTAQYYMKGEKREDDFDLWYGAELPPAERAVFRAELEKWDGGWGSRGEVLKYMKTAQEMRASGEDISTFGEPTKKPSSYRGIAIPADGDRAARVARDLVFELEKVQAKDAVRVAAAIRDLADNGVFPKDGKYNTGSLTRAQKTQLMDAWSRMPSEYRKTVLPEGMWKRPISKWSPDSAQLETMRNDIAQYGVDNGIRNSERLRADITATTTGPLAAKIATISAAMPENIRTSRGTARRVPPEWTDAIRQGQVPPELDTVTGILTLDEENLIRSLWTQRGGDPRIPLAVQAINLQVPPGGGTAQHSSVDPVQAETAVWQAWFDEYQPKIGD